jgi:hypothetical protein
VGEESTADEFSSLLQASIEEESYSSRQVFNLDEAILFWKWDAKSIDSHSQ